MSDDDLEGDDRLRPPRDDAPDGPGTGDDRERGDPLVPRSVFGVPAGRLGDREPEAPLLPPGPQGDEQGLPPRRPSPSGAEDEPWAGPELVRPPDRSLPWGRIEDPVRWDVDGAAAVLGDPVRSNADGATADGEPGVFASSTEPPLGWPAGDEPTSTSPPPFRVPGHVPQEPRRRRSRNPIDRLTEGLPHWARVLVDWIVTIVGAVIIVLLVKAFVVNPYRIPSSSMEPTLHCAQGSPGCEAGISDRVLANRFIYHFTSPKRGDIVVFTTPPAAAERCGAGGTFVKRLIGLPGETLELRLIRGDGYVFINGKQLDEPYIETQRRQVNAEYGPTTIPQDAYFMMGDNREQSCDSREWGTVPRENLIGKVFMTYWPPNRISFR